MFSNNAQRATLLLEDFVRTRPHYAFGGCASISSITSNAVLAAAATTGSLTASASAASAAAAAAVPTPTPSMLDSSIAVAVARNLNALYNITGGARPDARRALMDAIGREYGADDFEWATLCAE
jgi:hypothetical protein